MELAVDMYRELWPALKHKFPAQFGLAYRLPPNQFFSLTVQCEEDSIALPAGFSVTTCFQGRLSTNELDWNTFEEAREQTMADGTRFSLPTMRHTVR